MAPATACSGGVCETGVKCHSNLLFLVVLLGFGCPCPRFSWEHHQDLCPCSASVDFRIYQALLYPLTPSGTNLTRDFLGTFSLSAGSSCAVSIGRQGGIYAKPGSCDSRFSPCEEHFETQQQQHNLTAIRAIIISQHGTSQ